MRTDGYTYLDTLAFGSVTHANENDVGACPDVNTATDGEIPLKVTITNETNFNAEPGINLWFGTTGSSVAVVDSQGCEDANTDGSVAYASSPLSDGQSVGESVYIYIPALYSPQFPNGSAAVLAEHPLGVSYDSPSQPLTAQAGESPQITYTVTAPDGTVSNDTDLDLGTLMPN